MPMGVEERNLFQRAHDKIKSSFDYQEDLPERTLFNRIYDEAIISIGAPCDISSVTRTEVAERIILTLQIPEYADNKAIRALRSGTTLFEYSEKIRREAIGGLRKVLPGNLKVKNLEEIRALEALVPGVSHYRTSNPFMLDNPTTGTAYGGLAALAHVLTGNSDVLDSPEEIWHTLANSCPELGFGLSAGFILGGLGMIYFRNKSVKDRADPENPRIWDTTQFLDMIEYFAKQGPQVLSNIRGKEYPSPTYSTLPRGRLTSNPIKAIKNLKSNPFIQRVGVKVV